MKIRLIALPILALGGFAVTGLAVARFNAPPRTGPVPAAPAPIPFPNRVAGVGIVEPSSETILLGTQVGGIVAQVMVKEGDRVTKGQPLIEIDARDADARLAAARAKVETAKSRVAAAEARVAQLVARPRAEDLAEMHRTRLQRLRDGVELLFAEYRRLGQHEFETAAARERNGQVEARFRTRLLAR